MSSEKVFVVVEAVDRPAGAMLVRYQIVERVELDPEEERLASAPSPLIACPPGMPQDDWEIVQSQIAAAEAIFRTKSVKKVTYRTEEKVVICTKTEEVAAAISEAKEQYEEIRTLKKSGARFEMSVPSLRAF
jgi:hypothetical protein